MIPITRRGWFASLVAFFTPAAKPAAKPSWFGRAKAELCSPKE